MNWRYLQYQLLKPFKSVRHRQLRSIMRKRSKKLGLRDKAIEEVAAYTGDTIDVVGKKSEIGSASESKFNDFYDQASLTKDKIERFYKECKFYIYELPVWNAEVSRPYDIFKIVSPYLRKFGYKKLADFGGGAGDLCIEFATNGCDITYCDIGEELMKFAEWRFDRRCLKVPIVKGIDALTGKELDCLLSFDVFEHLKDMDVMVQKMVDAIRPGGMLSFSGAFAGGTLHLEENNKYDDFTAMNILLEKLGLKFYDKFGPYFFYRKL
jgi:2-polyprenyl-3-methyl-5-hydroxy-6-metoxy-1,4-benzoquinol methylase